VLVLTQVGLGPVDPVFAFRIAGHPGHFGAIFLYGIQPAVPATKKFVLGVIEHRAGPDDLKAVPLLRLTGQHQRILWMLLCRVEMKRNAIGVCHGFAVQDQERLERAEIGLSVVIAYANRRGGTFLCKC
jgi:hypothetical protein